MRTLTEKRRKQLRTLSEKEEEVEEDITGKEEDADENIYKKGEEVEEDINRKEEDADQDKNRKEEDADEDINRKQEDADEDINGKEKDSDEDINRKEEVEEGIVVEKIRRQCSIWQKKSKSEANYCTVLLNYLSCYILEKSLKPRYDGFHCQWGKKIIRRKQERRVVNPSPFYFMEGTYSDQYGFKKM